MNSLISFIALLVERYFGYPERIQLAIGHPVQWMGTLIGWFDTRFNLETDDDQTRRRAGILMLIVLLGATLFIAGAIAAILRDLPLGWVAEALLATTFLAQRHLRTAVIAVADGLDISVEAGRAAVSQIVGRDTSQLEDAEISRAAIETLAENTSDGIIAPLFWMLIFGLPGIALYKAINTADSMVGHLSPRHTQFGWASARLDDLVNWIPARLTAFLFVGAASIMPEASAQDAWETVRDDAKKHKSPNAGWPESAMAGALHFGLGGPRTYNGQMLDLPQMGDGRRNLGAEDIRNAVRLYDTALWVALGIVGAVCLVGALSP